MARLPDVTDRRPIGDGRRPVVAMRNAGAVAAATVGLGQDVSAIAQQMALQEERAREEETAAATADADVLVSQKIRETLYDPEKGYLNTAQFAAVSGRQKTIDDLGAMRDEAMKGLPPAVAKRLRPVLANRVETALRQVDTHASGERRSWLDAASLARMGMASDDALARFQSPEEIDHHLRIGLGELSERAQRLGWDAAQHEAEREKYVSGTLKGVIFRRAQADPAGAMAYARENSGRLAAADMAHVESVVGAAAKEFEGRAWADGAMAASGPFSMDGYLGLVTRAESGNDPTARNPRSSAGGLGQFTDGTWRETIRKYAPHVAAGRSDAEILAMKTNASPEGQAFHMRMLRHLTQENIATLAAGGAPVNAGTAYMAHFFGAKGAVRIMREIAGGRNPSVEVMFPEAVKANPHLSGMLATDARDWAYRTVGFAGEDPLVAALGIPDPAVREAALSRVDQVQRVQASSMQRARREAQEALWQAVEGGTDPRTVPPEIREAAGLDVVRALEAYHDEKAAGFSPKTDPELYAELLKEAYQAPAAFETRELLAHRDKLSEGDYRKLTEMQASVQKGEPPQSVSFTEAHRMWRSAGVEAGQAGTDQAQEFARLELAYVEQWAGFVAANGRQPGVVEQMEIARRVAPQSPLFNRPRDAEGFTGSVPSLRSAADPALRAAGLSPSPKPGKSEAGTVAAFHEAHIAAAQRFVAKTGDQPTDAETSAMATRLLRKFQLDGGLFSLADDKYAFEVSLDDLDAVRRGEQTLYHEGREITLQEIQMAGRLLLKQGNSDPTIDELLDVVVE